jgi:hypothetical protein
MKSVACLNDSQDIEFLSRSNALHVCINTAQEII